MPCAIANIELVVVKLLELFLQACAGSSACRPSARRRPRASCCRRHGSASPPSAKYRHTSDPIRPDDPVTSILRMLTLLRDYSIGLVSRRRNRSVTSCAALCRVDSGLPINQPALGICSSSSVPPVESAHRRCGSPLPGNPRTSCRAGGPRCTPANGSALFWLFPNGMRTRLR